MAEPVQIIERVGLTMATVMARKGASPAAIGERLGLAPADGPRVSRAGALALIGVGPGVWLAAAEDGRATAELAERLAGLASVSDQSSTYRVLRFTGPGAGRLLQKGAFIDLDPHAFPPGAAAVTVIAHVGVTLWKVDAAPTFDVAVFRSYAGSFQHWIASAGGPVPHLS